MSAVFYRSAWIGFFGFFPTKVLINFPDSHQIY